MKKEEILTVALNALRELLHIFRVERYVYLALTGLSFILLLYVGMLMFTTKEIDKTTLVAVFGSSGLVAASSARVSLFFNKAFTLIEDLVRKLAE